MSVSVKNTKKINKILENYSSDLSKKQKKKLAKKIVEVFFVSGSTEQKYKPRSITSQLSITKKNVFIRFGDNDLSDWITPGRDLTKHVITLDKSIRDNKKMMNVKVETVKKILGLQNSDNPKELLIWLLFTTGRRSTEMFHAKFGRSRDQRSTKKKNYLFMSGVAKRRSLIPVECEFPVIGSARIVFEKIVFFRSQKKIDYKSFTITTGLLIKKKYGPEWTLHKLRGLYVAWHLAAGSRKGMRPNTFIQSILCHKNVESSLAYTGVRIV